MIDRLVDAGVPADRCRRVLGVARQNYYKAKQDSDFDATAARVAHRVDPREESPREWWCLRAGGEAWIWSAIRFV
ncbi:hypothetical protein JCM18899A_54900 [Nocardioides sp. AN3]